MREVPLKDKTRSEAEVADSQRNTERDQVVVETSLEAFCRRVLLFGPDPSRGTAGRLAGFFGTPYRLG